MAVITISRQFGSGGYTLAKRLSDKLGYRLIQKEMIAEIAEKTGVSREGVKRLEKSAGSLVNRLVDSLVSKGYIERLLEGRHGVMDEKKYVDTVSEIVEEICREDNAVIVGRAGQLILRGAENALHVNLIADLEYRVGFLESRYNVDRKKAEDSIHREDRQRQKLAECFGESSVDDPLLYHLVINMARVSMDTAERLVLDLLP